MTIAFPQTTPQVRGLRVEDLVGNTPLLHLANITAHLPRTIAVYAKAEWTNPGGSVKDRAALNIIMQANWTVGCAPA